MGTAPDEDDDDNPLRGRPKIRRPLFAVEPYSDRMETVFLAFREKEPDLAEAFRAGDPHLITYLARLEAPQRKKALSNLNVFLRALYYGFRGRKGRIGRDGPKDRIWRERRRYLRSINAVLEEMLDASDR